MEEENVIKEAQGSYLTGIIGAIIGGTIATIPWVLMYVYGGMMLSILAALIAAGEFYGYKLLKGKMSKGLPAILMVLALVIVTVATLVVIPGLLIQKEGLNPSVANIKKLYSNEEFATAIMKDFVISVVFTILGASIITSNIKKQLANAEEGKEIKLDLNNTEENLKMKKEAIELVKPIFVKYEATSKEKAMMKEEVLAEIEIENQNAKQVFSYLQQSGIVKKYKGKYYYSEENENKQINPKKNSTWKKVVGIIGAIILVLVVVATILDNWVKSDIDYNDEKVSFKMAEDWTASEENEEREWGFYKYINTFPAQSSTSQQDYSSYPAAIGVYYDVIDENISSIEDIKTNVQNSIESSEDKADETNFDISKTSGNYDLLKVKVLYKTYPEELWYYYYILDGDNLACITAHTFSLADQEEMEKAADKLVNSFKWM